MTTTSSAFLEELVELTEDLVIRLDPRGRLRYVSPAAERILGRAPGYYVGRKALTLVDRAERASTLRAVEPLLAGRTQRATVETRVTDAGGNPRYIMWKASSFSAGRGGSRGIGAIGRDISEYRQAADQLRRREEMWNYLLLLVNLTWIVLVTMEEGRLLDCSEAFCRDTGYKKEEVLGRNTVEIGLWRGRRDREDILQLIRTHGVLDRYPVKLGMKNGELRDLLWSTTVIEVQGEKCLLSVLVDVTDLRNAESKLAQANAELQARTVELADMNAALKVLLQQREDDKKELESRVWHNIRNMIQPYLHGLKNTALSVSQSAYVNVIGTRLDEITSGLGERLGSSALGLSSRELEVAGHVAEGLKNKEIAEILNISVHSVESHRFAIRKKLGLLGRRSNLRTRLLALSRQG